MAELGSHQLDAASIFIAAAHGGKMEHPHPLNVSASATRPLFPPDRDVEDHVCCMLEFPAPGYDPKDKFLSRKKICVSYAAINGNDFGGYGEIVFGTKGTLILEREQEALIFKGGDTESKVGVAKGKGGPTLDTQASGASQAAAVGAMAIQDVSRGYTEELEHFAWCVRNRDPKNLPRCHAEVAMGDAIIALTANIAAREQRRIEFKEDWFSVESDETPEGVAPNVSKYV
jgi:predicted dehydrogenase